MSATSNQAKRVVWNKIMEEMQPLGIPPDPLVIRNKIHGLKRSYHDHEKSKRILNIA